MADLGCIHVYVEAVLTEGEVIVGHGLQTGVLVRRAVQRTGPVVWSLGRLHMQTSCQRLVDDPFSGILCLSL